jgi:glyoxylase-like metal-dependent hydrolase (beta-lactamase superfamily II)
VTAELSYPVAAPPEPGQAIPLAAGVHWARLPVPGPLRHINVWLLEDGDGWTLIDTGMDVPAARAAWEGGLHDYLRDRPLVRIICTHHHPDHAGLAAWLSARHGAPVYMSEAESALLRRLAATGDDPAEQARRLAAFARDGLDATDATRPVLSIQSYRRVTSGVPADIRPLGAGDVVATGATRWVAHLVRGHTDGQLVFHAADLGLLIAGDQVLPRISSNIGIYPERRDRDPIASFLASFDGLEALEPEPLVLPSHGAVFRGLRHRLAQLRSHHAATLATVTGLVTAPTTARELAERLFRAPLDPLNLVLAVGETLANLEHLAARGVLAVVEAPGGPRRYQPAPAF